MIYIETDTLANGVFMALDELDFIGDEVEGENQSNKDILLDETLVMNIFQPLSDKDVYIPKCIAGSLEDLKSYVDEVLLGTKDGQFTYTYHELYEKYMPKLREEIGRYRYTRRGTLPIAGEVSYASEYPPCLQLILPRIIKLEGSDVEFLDFTVVFRSNDAVNAFPMNSFALAMMQKELAEEFGVEVGTFVYFANSFHCYSRDRDKLRKYVLKYRKAKDHNEYAYTFAHYEEACQMHRLKEYMKKEKEQRNGNN